MTTDGIDFYSLFTALRGIYFLGSGFMARIFKSVGELIGGTPLVELSNIEKKCGAKARILAKLESFNPGGSVKDRVAKMMIDDAEKSGVLAKDSVIIEPTSGNTGIGLSCVAASRGYKVVIVMPETMSVERRMVMSALGAQLVLSPGSEGMAGAIKLAEEIQKSTPNSFIAGQFVNPSNPKAHFESTGPEIWDDTDGGVDFFVAGVGTGGTVSGTGKFLKSKKSGVKIVAVEPENSAVLSGKKAGPHGLQGIGAGFVPEILDRTVIDEIISATDEEAFEAGRMLAKSEGILAGISSGAALSAAIKIAQKSENEGKTVVVLLPDTGDRYLSTKLFSE